MEDILWYLVKDDDAFFFLEFLFVNGKLYAKDLEKESRIIFSKFISKDLVYENFIKRGLHVTKYYNISKIGVDYYFLAQAIREKKGD